MDFAGVLRGLRDAGIEHVLIGGVAAVVQGAPFTTNDVDVCYGADTANIARLVRLLTEWKAYPRGWEDGLSFVLDARTFVDTPVLTLRTTMGDMDLLDRVDGIGDYKAVLARSRMMDLGGIEVRTLDVVGIIAAKEAAGRPKDREHVKILRALLELDGDGQP